MKFLLQNKFAPTTLGFGFLQCDWDQAKHSFELWLSQLGRLLDVGSLQGSLDSMLQMLEPLRPSKDKDLLTRTKNKWVAYFGNGAFGSDADPVISHLATRIRCVGVTFKCIPDRRKARLMHHARESYGSVCLQIFGPEEKNYSNSVRTICAARDGARWVFENRGEMQPFEDPSFYGMAKIADRFPPELLDRYLQALGIDAFDEQFYEQDGLLLTRDTRDYHNPKVLKPYTFAEIQLKMRLDIPE